MEALVWNTRLRNYKARFHCFGERDGVGVIYKAGVYDMGPHLQVYLGHVLDIFRELIRGFHDLLRQKLPSLLIL
jgi:hypothetical protein